MSDFCPATGSRVSGLGCIILQPLRFRGGAARPSRHRNGDDRRESDTTFTPAGEGGPPGWKRRWHPPPARRSVAPMSLSISELEAAIDRLYQGPIAEFTQARNTLAAECKAAGDKAGAARVKELTKPSAVAWAVNQLYWRDRERFDALAQAMAELAAAQREALGGGGAAALTDATCPK